MKKFLFIAIIQLLFSYKVICQIEGIVIDRKKTPLVNALIIVTDTTGKVIDSVKSDKRGVYAFNGLKPGKYNVEAKTSGFQSNTYKSIVVSIPPEGTDEGDDTYYAIRLDIILTQLKDKKQ